MRRECARTYRILVVKMRKNRGIVRRKAPGSGRGTHMIDVTSEIDLRKEPLDFKNSFAEKSFVKSNGR
jgi:hypothetical protein